MLNHIVIMGRLTRDPELRYTQSQTPVVSFSVAVDRDFGGRDGGEKQTDFIDCVAWRSTAEFVSKYFRKGSMVVVSGRLQIRDWQGSQRGQCFLWREPPPRRRRPRQLRSHQLRRKQLRQQSRRFRTRSFRF